MVPPAAHREAAVYLQSTYKMSERRACRVLGVDRASVRYVAIRPADQPLRDRLKSLAHQRRRFGYRRLHVLLRREGHLVNRSAPRAEHEVVSATRTRRSATSPTRSSPRHSLTTDNTETKFHTAIGIDTTHGGLSAAAAKKDAVMH
jgi:transposase InsO family protein